MAEDSPGNLRTSRPTGTQTPLKYYFSQRLFIARICQQKRLQQTKKQRSPLHQLWTSQ